MKITMRHAIHTLLLFVILFVTACGGDYRQRAIGDNEVIIVIMDSTMQDGATAEALESTFGRVIETLPGRDEQLYLLRYHDFRNNEQLDELRKYKNIIVAGVIDDQNNVSTFIRALLSQPVEERVRAGESFAFPLRDHWYRDQWTLILTSTDDEALAQKINDAVDPLVDNLQELEFERWRESIYRRHEQTTLSDALMDRYGWSVRMQHDYVQTVDTLQVVSYRRSLPDNDRWMWGWWKDDFDSPELIDGDWINARRDSLMERYVQGTREGSYVTTEYRRPVVTRQLQRDDRLLAWETLGTWQMTNDLMGGPFVNLTYFDPSTGRVFMVEYGQFAPRVAKRRFVQQFRAMARTFESDSTFTSERYPEGYQRSNE